MIRLNAGFSRKVGEANYGSRGASVNVELELESNLITDPDGLMGRIRNLFAIARRAVDEELTNGQPGPEQVTPPDNDRRGRGNGDRPVRGATASQFRAIRAICNERQLNADHLASERFQVDSLAGLTIREASQLIDELKAKPSRGHNGGGR